MGLTDLRGREDDPIIRALLAAAHASPTSLARAVGCFGNRAWILVGWEEDGTPVACAGVERVGPDELVLRSVAVAPGYRRRGFGRALVDAIADVATARRLTAETDDDAVGFYRRCGFTVGDMAPEAGRARFSCVRAIAPRPAEPNAVGAFTLSDVEEAIRGAWGLDTSDDPDEWSEDNPARGQCAVTALVIRELLGGEILIANVLRDGARVDRHAWNRLGSGLTIDLTRSQFRRGEEFEEPSAGAPIMTDQARYELLAQRVRARLSA